MTDTQIQSALNAISSLQLSVADLNAQMGSLSSQVHALGGTVTPQGQAVTTITNTITSQASARASADDALATRIGAFSCNLPGEKAATHATSRLTSRVASAEESTLAVDPGQAVEPLRLGKVTFYGESARVIRDAQEVLRAAGAGQLEVVKRANEPGEPFVVIDGQVFLSQAEIDAGRFAIDPARFKVRVEKNEQGQYYAAGIGLGVVDGGYGKALEAGGVMEYISALISESALGSSLHEQVTQVIRDELKPGGMLYRG